MGWQVEPPPRMDLTWQAYERLAADAHGAGELSRVRYLHDNIKPKDLIWSRDADGKYYLAQVKAPRIRHSDDGLAWEYYNTPAGRDADIVNVVQCRILPVPKADDVPGKIVACFRPSRTIQSITDETAVLYSQLLWNQISNSKDYSLPELQQCDIFSFLDAETTEDVIFIYLQCEGWVVVPNSRKADTMSYEFLAINRKTHARALVQVRTGNTPLDRAHWGAFPETVFLFQAHGIYAGVPTQNIVQLSPETIRDFMEEQFDVMPRSVQRWIKFVKGRSSGPLL